MLVQSTDYLSSGSVMGRYFNDYWICVLVAGWSWLFICWCCFCIDLVPTVVVVVEVVVLVVAIVVVVVYLVNTLK